jgi:aminomethyltransferase
LAVRSRAGLFDASHMGEFILYGRDAFENAQNLFTNDFAGMADGNAKYTLMCDESGGILDDMLIYRVRGDRYYIVANAANREADAAWIEDNIRGNAAFQDVTDETALIAIQGPASRAILEKLADGAPPAASYAFKADQDVAGVGCIVSHTGYTGEDGFELICDSSCAGKVWDALLEAGHSEGLAPCGLGSRDTLRLEAGMPLYGHEISRAITPFEAKLNFAVRLRKKDFIGKSALLGKKSPSRIRIGIKMAGRGIARENYGVYKDGRLIGTTTSGTFCPYLGYAAAMALVDAGTGEGEEVTVDVRGRPAEAVTAALPFYKRKA